MTWTRTGGGSNGTGSAAVNTLSVTNSASVAVGDVVCVAMCREGTTTSIIQIHDPTNGAGKDSLGNTYNFVVGASDVPNDERLELWVSVITASGTPTIRQRSNPSPGTTTFTYSTIIVASFTGSDASSVTDGSNAQLQATPGIGTDGVSSNTFTTTANGDLVYGASISDSATGLDPGAVGTNFTQDAFFNTAAMVWMRTEYLTQSSAGSIAATFTAGTNNSHITAGVAVKPAAAGGGVTTVQIDGAIPRGLLRGLNRGM